MVARRYAAGVPLSLAAVAVFCFVSVDTVRGWVDAGKLPVLRLPQGNGHGAHLVRVETAALARFLEAYRA